MARQVLENGVILPAEYSDDWYDDMTSNLTKLDDVIGSDSEKLSSADVGAAALSNNYNDLDNLPTIPTVNDATLTIQKNGVDVQTFTANASSNVTCNITVPTKTSDLTNDSDFVVSSSLATVATSGSYTDLDDKPTINDSTITIQKNGSTVDSFTTNGSAKTINIPVPTKTSDLTNDSNFVDSSNPAVSSGITSAKVTDYDTHIADTDIHVTTADKDRWNNNTYVFRYSSTALVASSTNSNALLDNTDNLKVGDKVIDSSGVLFSVTAIDTQNSTFTIGTALIDLAQDSDVVHKSGDETISGNKTFSSNVNVYNSDSATDTANIILKNSKAERGSTTDIGEQNIFFLDKNNAQIGNIKCEADANGYSNLTLQCSDTNDTSSGVQIRKTTTGITFQPTSNSQCYLGQSIRKWHSTYTNKINGLEPSSLSLPGDRSARIDISSYFTNTGTGGINRYTVPANGYIWLHFTSINSVLCFSQTSGALTNYAQTFVRSSGDGVLYAFFPVRKDDIFVAQIYTSSTAVVQNAFFIPCQGNV